MKKKLFALKALLLFAFVCSPGLAQNLITNGGFEEAAGTTPPAWTLEYGAQVLSGDAPEGSLFCRVDGENGEFGQNQAATSDGITVEEGKAYSVSFKARVSQWDAGNGSNVCLRYLDPDNDTVKWIDMAYYGDAPVIENVWRGFTYDFFGKDTTINICVSGHGAVIDVDDFVFSEIDPSLVNLYGNGRDYNSSFERTTWYWSWYFNGAGLEFVSDDVNDGRLALKLNEENEYVRHAGRMIVDHLDTNTTYVLSVWVKVTGYTGPNELNPRVGYVAFESAQADWTHNTGEWDADVSEEITQDTNGWVEKTFLISGAEIVQFYAQWRGQSDANGYMLVDGITLKEQVQDSTVTQTRSMWTLY